MSQRAKFREKLLDPQNNRNIDFKKLVNYLSYLGFDRRQEGTSHQVFTKDGIDNLIVLQPRNDGKAKPYQVDQVRETINQYGL